MPFVNEIQITARDLFEIIDRLASMREKPTGILTIRDTGTQYVIRDINDQHIITVEQSHDSG